MRLLLLYNKYFLSFILIAGVTSIILNAYEENLNDSCENNLEPELTNLILFAQFAAQEVGLETFETLGNFPLISTKDLLALETLKTHGLTEIHARFVCNYFLYFNEDYPGHLITLSSKTDDYVELSAIQGVNDYKLQQFYKTYAHEIIKSDVTYELAPDLR